MKEYDGQITSSPGPTPLATSARCSAVVHDVVATPYATPMRAATSVSNSATFGPWLTQPLLRTPATARASSSPNSGRVNGIIDWAALRLRLRRATLVRGATSRQDRAALLRDRRRRGIPARGRRRRPTPDAATPD